MKYKYIIWDLDGTLLDTLDDLTDAVNAAMTLFGYPSRTRDEVRSFVGNGFARLLELATPDGCENKNFDGIMAEFKRYYELNSRRKTAPYSGIPELLLKLKNDGREMAIVSNKGDSSVKELAGFYFPDIFTAAIGECKGISRKPSPDTVNEAIRLLEADREYTVYVGDSEVDVATAANAGIRCISVLWGFRDKKFLTERGARIFASSPDELSEMLG